MSAACAGVGPRAPLVASDLDPGAGTDAQHGEFDLTELALIVSGYERPEQLRTARAELDALVAPILSRTARVEDPAARAEALLEELHRVPLLAAYDARATTLREIIEARRFNCLSASVLYALLAERAGLDVGAQLLPTHARVIVRLERGAIVEPVIVETTSPQGFDPDPGVAAQILERVAGPAADRGRSLVPDRGAAVSNLVLIGAMYVNRASIAQESGDLALAEKLFERGEALAGSDAMKQVLRDQRAALLSQLAANDIMSGDPERVVRAYRTIKAAAALGPEVPAVRSAVLQNLRAAAERMIARIVGAGDEAASADIVDDSIALGLDEEDGAGLRAFQMSEIARWRASAGNVDGAVEAIERALGEQLTGRDADLKRTLEQNRVAALRLAAMTSAKSGDLTKSMQLIERLQNVPGLSGSERELYALDRRQALHAVAEKWIADGDLRGAAEIYRQGVRRHPEDPAMRNNLLAVLERLVLPLVEQGRCDAIVETLREIAALDGAGTFSTKARVRCLTIRAGQRLEKRDHAEAVALLRAAREADPADETVARNLGVALLRWAADEAAEGRCLRAAELIRELEGSKGHNLSRARIAGALGACGP